MKSYKQRMGWNIPWVSTAGGDFNRDLGFTNTQEELRPFLGGGIPPVVTQMAEASAAAGAVGLLNARVELARDATTRSARLRRVTTILASGPVLPVDTAVATRYGELRRAAGRAPTNDLRSPRPPSPTT